MRRIRCNSWRMPWKRSATVWPSFISVSWSVLVYQLDGWACRWFGCLKNFLYFGMLLGFPKIHYIITWKVEPISSANSCADFQNPKLKKKPRNECRHESDPPVFHSSFQTSQNRRSVETKPRHPYPVNPFDSRGYGHEQHGDFQPSNIYYEERTNVVTFIDATDSGFFFCCNPYKKC